MLGFVCLECDMFGVGKDLALDLVRVWNYYAFCDSLYYNCRRTWKARLAGRVDIGVCGFGYLHRGGGGYGESGRLSARLRFPYQNIYGFLGIAWIVEQGLCRIDGESQCTWDEWWRKHLAILVSVLLLPRSRLWGIWAGSVPRTSCLRPWERESEWL